MDRIEQIRDLDDLIFEEFQEYFPKTMKSNFSKKHPKTFHISNLFTTSTNFIKNSIFDCSETDDLFGIKILFRSLIEHYLRFNFVTMNWMEQKNDSLSEKYLEFTAARENLDFIKSIIAEQKLSDPDVEVTSWQRIFDEIPSLKKYSKKEIEQEAMKYSYKNLVKKLKVIYEGSDYESPVLGHLIREYSQLSSFVHGGAGAHEQMFILNDEKKRRDEYYRICGLAYQMAATVKLFSLAMIVQTDKNEFSEHYLKVNKFVLMVNEI